MKVPEQKYWPGQLVVAIKDHFVYFNKGDVGIITNAFCHEVCTRGGRPGLTPEEGGPEYAMEWGYVGLFDIESTPQGVRLDRLSPVKVIR